VNPRKLSEVLDIEGAHHPRGARKNKRELLISFSQEKRRWW